MESDKQQTLAAPTGSGLLTQSVPPPPDIGEKLITPETVAKFPTGDTETDDNCVYKSKIYGFSCVLYNGQYVWPHVWSITNSVVPIEANNLMRWYVNRGLPPPLDYDKAVLIKRTAETLPEAHDLILDGWQTKYASLVSTFPRAQPALYVIPKYVTNRFWATVRAIVGDCPIVADSMYTPFELVKGDMTKYRVLEAHPLFAYVVNLPFHTLPDLARLDGFRVATSSFPFPVQLFLMDLWEHYCRSALEIPHAMSHRLAISQHIISETVAKTASGADDVIKKAKEAIEGLDASNVQAKTLFAEIREYLTSLRTSANKAWEWTKDRVNFFIANPCAFFEDIVRGLATKTIDLIKFVANLFEDKFLYSAILCIFVGTLILSAVFGVPTPLWMKAAIGIFCTYQIGGAACSIFTRIAAKFSCCQQGVLKKFAEWVMDTLELAFGPVKFVAKLAGVMSLWQFLRDASKVMDGAKWTWELIKNVTTGLINGISTALGLEDWIYFERFGKQFTSWMRRAESIINASNDKPLSFDQYETLRVLRSEGNHLMGVDGEGVPKELHAAFSSLMRDLNSLVQSSGPSTDYHKMEPFILVAVGDPGVGKTHVFQHLIQHIMEVPGSFSGQVKGAFSRNSGSVVYIRNPEKKYWPKFSDHRVGIYDEFQAVPDADHAVEEYMDFLRAGNDLASYIEGAAVEAKGQRNCLELMLTSTNAKTLAHPKMTSAGAPVRRMDLIVKAVPGNGYVLREGKLWKITETGPVEVPPGEGFAKYNPDAVRFAVIKGRFSLKGQDYDINHMSAKYEIPDEGNFMLLSFNELASIVSVGLIKKRQKYADGMHDLTIQTERAKDLYADSTIATDASKAEQEQATSPAYVTALGAKINCARISELSIGQIITLMRMADYAPTIAAEVAVEFLALHDAEAKAKVDLNPFKRAYRGFALFWAQWTPKIAAVGRKWWWITCIAAGVGALGFAIYKFWPAIKVFLPASWIAEKKVHKQSVHAESVETRRGIIQMKREKRRAAPQQTRHESNRDKQLEEIEPWVMHSMFTGLNKQGEPDGCLMCNVKGQLFIMSKHQSQDWIDASPPGKGARVIRVARCTQRDVAILVNVDEAIATMHDVPGTSDLVYFYIQEADMGHDISKYLFDENTLERCIGTDLKMKAHFFRNTKDGWKFCEVNAPAVHMETINLESNRRAHSFGYEATTLIGDCSTPILVVNKRTNGKKVLGFHIAGSLDSDCGFAEFVPFSVIKSLKSTLKQQHVKEIRSTIQNGKPIVSDVDRLGPQYELEHQMRLNRKTQLVPSAFADDIGPTRFPPNQWPDERGDPLIRCQEKMFRLKPFGDWGILNACIDAYFNMLDSLPNTMPYRSYLSHEEAARGVPELGRGAVPANTYAGYNYDEAYHPNDPNVAAIRKEHNKGRQAFLGDRSKGEYTGKLFVELVRDCEIADGLAISGIALVHPVSIQMKDELRKPGKDPRIIRMLDVQHQLRIAQYFSGFNAWFYSKRIHGWHTLGINANGDDMHVMGVLLRTLKMLGGDLEGCDLSLFWEHARRALATMERVYFQKCPDYKVEHAAIREALLYEVFHAYCLYIKDGKTFAYWFSGNLSGSGLTSIITTIMCITAYLYALSRIIQTNSTIPLVAFWSNLRQYLIMFANGDDNIIAPLAAMPKFTPQQFQKFLAEFGWVYTDAHKRPTLEWDDIRTITYLKRNFKYHDGLRKWVGALDINVIWDLLCWVTRSGDSPREQLRMRTVLFLAYMSFHPKEVYDAACSRVEALWKAHYHYSFVTMPWKDQAKEVANIEESLGLHIDVELRSVVAQSSRAAIKRMAYEETIVEQALELLDQVADNESKPKLLSKTRRSRIENLIREQNSERRHSFRCTYAQSGKPSIERDNLGRRDSDEGRRVEDLLPITIEDAERIGREEAWNALPNYVPSWSEFCERRRLAHTIADRVARSQPQTFRGPRCHTWYQRDFHAQLIRRSYPGKLRRAVRQSGRVQESTTRASDPTGPAVVDSDQPINTVTDTVANPQQGWDECLPMGALHTPISIAQGTINSGSSTGITAGPYGVVQSLYNASAIIQNLLIGVQGFRPEMRYILRIPRNANANGHIGIRYIPSFQTWTDVDANGYKWMVSSVDAFSRLPGAYFNPSCDGEVRCDIPWNSSFAFFDVNALLDQNLSDNGAIIITIEEPPTATSGVTYLSWSLWAYLRKVTMGPPAPLITATPTVSQSAKPYVEKKEMAVTADKPKEEVATKVEKEGPAEPLVSMDSGIKVGSGILAPINAVAGSIGDLLGGVADMLGFSHTRVNDAMWSGSGTTNFLHNTDGPEFPVSLALHTKSQTAALKAQAVDQMQITFLASKQQTYSSFAPQLVYTTAAGTKLAQIVIHPVGNEKIQTIGTKTVFLSPHPAAVAALTHRLWGAEKFIVTITNTGPLLVGANVRVVYYYWYLATAAAQTINWKLSEVAPHHDWDLGISRSITYEIDLAMPLPMVPLTVALGQVDMIALTPPTASSYSNSNINFRVEIGWGGFRVAAPADGRLVPVNTLYDTTPAIRNTKQQSDSKTSCHSIVRLTGAKPMTAKDAAMCCELNLSFRNFAKSLQYLSSTLGSADTTHYLVYYPGSFQMDYTSSGTFVGANATTLHAIMLGFVRYKGTPRLLLTSNSSGGTNANAFQSVRKISYDTALTAFSVSSLSRISNVTTAPPVSDRIWYGMNVSQPVAAPMDAPSQWMNMVANCGATPIPYSLVSPQCVLVFQCPSAGWNSGIIYEYFGEDFDVDGYIGFPPMYTTRVNVTTNPTSTLGKLKRLPGHQSLNDIVVLHDGSRVSIKEAYYRAQGLISSSGAGRGTRV